MIILTKKLELRHQCLDQIYVTIFNAYIIVKGDITITNPNNAKRNKAVAFKNNAPFINCI